MVPGSASRYSGQSFRNVDFLFIFSPFLHRIACFLPPLGIDHASIVFPGRRLPVLDKFDYMDDSCHKKSKKHPSLSHSLKMKAKMDAKNVLQ